MPNGEDRDQEYYYGAPGFNVDAPEIVTAAPGSIVAQQEMGAPASEQAPPGIHIPAGATVKERDAQGKPTVYESGGKEYYAPGSTPYEAGFHTKDELFEAQRYNLFLGPHALGEFYQPGSPGEDLAKRCRYVSPVGRFSDKELQSTHGDTVRGFVNRGQTFIEVKDPLGKPHTFSIEKDGSSPAYEKYKEDEAKVDWESAKRGRKWVKATEGISQYFNEHNEFDIYRAVRDGVPAGRLVRLGYTNSDIKATKEYLAFVDSHIKLKTGEWISREDFEKLGKDSQFGKAAQAYLYQYGTEKYNANKDNLLPSSGGYVARDIFIEAYFKEKGWKYSGWSREWKTIDEAVAYDKQLKEAYQAWQGKYQPTISYDEYVQRYFAEKNWELGIKVGMLTPAEEQKVLPEYNARLNQAARAYAKEYGNTAMNQSLIGKGLEMFFAPAKAVRPEVELKDVRGIDWAVGAGQLALLTVPLSGHVLSAGASKVYSIGTRYVAGAIFTARTVQDWDAMNGTQRVVSVAVDTILLGSALYSTVKSSAVRHAVKSGFEAIRASTERQGAYEINNWLNDTSYYYRPSGETVESILRNMSDAVKKGDPIALKAAAERLQLAAGKVPKEIGGGVLAEKAKEIAAAPDKWIKVTKKGTLPVDPSDIEKGIKANEKFIQDGTDALKRVTDPARREAIEKAVEEAKKQVKVAVKEKTQPLPTIRTIKPGEVSPPAIRTDTVRTVVPPKPVPATVPRTTPGVSPVRVRPIPSVSPRVSPVTYAVAATSVAGGIKTLQEQKQAEKVSPGVQPVTQLQTTTRPEVETEAETKTKPEVQPLPYPKTQTKPGIQTKPLPEPQPEPQPQPLPEPEPEPEKEKKRRLPIQRGKAEEESEDYRGAVGWKQGQRRGKPVIHIIKRPYKTQRDVETKVGNVPSGVSVATGKGSAQRTARLLHGRGPKNVNLDMGAMDVHVTTEGKRIRLRFTPDPLGLTRHDMRIGTPRPRRPRMPTDSRRVGRQYITRVGNSIAVSRRPLRRRGR